MTTPTTAALTDRYIDAVLRRLLRHQRPDIERELRASIADAIDDRVTAGEDRDGAERAVLTELGDPARLAAGYSDLPLHLIGPQLFPDYVRLVATLEVVVVPIVAAVVAIVQAYQGNPIGSVIGGAIGAAITTGVHVAFWTTLVFAVIERIPAEHRPPARDWTPDALPQPPSRRERYAELVGVTSAAALFITAILLSPVVSPLTDAAGDPISFFAPWLWQTGVVYLYIGLVVLSLGNVFAKYYGPKRTSLAIVGALVDIAPAIVLIWLATNDHVLNPAFVEAAGWSVATPWIQLGLVISGAIAILSAIVEAVKRIRNR